MIRPLAASLFLLCTVVRAQPPVAPTDAKVGESRGQNAGGYNILQSWETGYRFRTAGGNQARYRSDVNYGNGIRLLAGRLSLTSRDGHGRLFDDLTLAVQGLGNDPYQSATLRIARNRLYRYDLLWRESDYYNPALPISFGEHRMDTSRRMQDHDFVLFPQSKVRFFAGFSRTLQQGPALTTVNVFDSVRGDEFALFADVRRRQNEFRFGNELPVFGVKLNWMQVWEMYREEVPASLTAPAAGNNPADRTRLNSLNRTQPYQGTTPSFRLNLFREKGERWALNGRFTYSAGRRDFQFDETATGIDRFNAAANRQIAAAGQGRRPVTTGQLTFSLFPTSLITLTNHTAFHSTRMEGDARYREIDNGDLQVAQVDFRYLGIRTLANSSDALFQLRPWIAFHGGYQYSNRLIRSTELVTIEDFTGGVSSEQTNVLHAGAAGVRFRPAKPLTLAFDGELGRQSRAFLPTSEKDYQSYSARLLWRQGPLSISGLARSYTNSNFVSLFAHSAESRNLALDGSWTPRDWFSLQAGYSRLHADTLTGLAYFLASALVRGEQSLYVSNLHTAHAGAQFSIRQRVELYGGFSLSRDAGDPRRSPGASLQPAFIAVQTFPMDFDSPLARISVKLHPKLRWNAGYQYYRYREDLLSTQNYRAHTGFTSVLWTF
ncbi:MAG: hypothetical protein HY858_16135 [Candidatus Solibacter usitatus]|nr:hypothetical protein [Candidatus Solibacter usitatus]